MKFFLVISIIALWWMPTNSPGNIDMKKVSLPSISKQIKNQSINYQKNTSLTKRKLDHYGYQARKSFFR
ncbi:hypothetical protein QYS48_30275 [Marivirga arenosa]|uniref:Uncharacterized protein n=1 Tax=Marivirga arenosa TaxID=3059076 RepID=A0AA51RDW2_9BACT|nr:hypothetical protein [Marivirga sp. ABR2-2]WMN07895.1 hypothetical protein QYS48_30275 [Marivirga sp. ABR2-2]